MTPLYDAHLNEIPILIWCDDCRRYIHNETAHPCQLDYDTVRSRGITRRIKTEQERQRRAVA